MYISAIRQSNPWFISRFNTHSSVSGKPACHTVSIFTGIKKMRFSHIHSSMHASFLNWNLFVLQIPSTFRTPHTKFEQDCLMQL